MPSLRIAIQGQVFEAAMPDREIRVGSDTQSDLCIASESVAAEHCFFAILPNGALKVRDANSGRGTRVNGQSVRQVSVNLGQEIHVGEAKIRYIADADRAAPAVAVAPIPVAPAAVGGAANGQSSHASGNHASGKQSSARQATTGRGDAPERRSTTDRRKAENAHIEPQVERRTAARRAGDRSRASEATSLRARRATKRSPMPWILGAAAVAVVGVLLSMGSGSSGDSAADQARLDTALAKVTAKDFAAARVDLDALRNVSSPDISRKAREALRSLSRTEQSIQAGLDERWLSHLDLTDGALTKLVSEFSNRHGTFGETRAKAFAGRVRKAQGVWLAERLGAMQSNLGALRQRHDYVGMIAAWDGMERSAPSGIDVADEAKAGRAAALAEANTASAELASRATDFAKAKQFDRAITILERALPGVEGLDGHVVLDRALTTVRQLEASQPDPTTTTQPDTPEPTAPVETPQPTTDNTAPDAAVVAAIKAHIDNRAFADAATAAREGGLPQRAGDLTRAATAFDQLRAQINASPKSFRNMSYMRSMRIDVLEATDKGFSAQIRGGSTAYKWPRVKAPFFHSLIKRWKPEGDVAFASATLLHLLGDDTAANRWLVVAGNSGAQATSMFDAIARWRGESVPEGGYVIHNEAYVTPVERERLIREARIEAALALIESKDADKRAEAYGVLFEIGEPAAERFRGALDRRRARLIDEIARSKSFTSSKYKKKLYTLLNERRAHALALIRDANAYPYPNPQKRNQKEVEDRVDKVEQVWERPFELVVEWDAALNERLKSITEIDTKISKLDRGYEPSLDTLRDRISKAINMPAYTPDSSSANVRSYSLKVLGFNEQVPTTATKEERNNVRAVNDYRMMMGMRSVKINERITRGARGHSRHMHVNDYFAHNVPGNKGADGTNRTPGNRAKTQGYTGGVGENIAMGTWTGYDAFRAWFGSSGHHRNMLGRWTEMGAGRSSGSWWTQLFGAASGRSLDVPAKLAAPTPAFAPEPEDDTGRPVGPPGGRVPDEAPPQDGEERDSPDDE